MAIRSLELFEVYYDDSDALAMVCAFASLIPQIILIVYATLIFSRREMETLMLLGGQVACEVSNNILKRAIKQDRPRYGPGYGMPSAHAQFVAFLATYLCLWMFFRMRQLYSPVKRVTRSVGLVVMTLVVSYSRVHLYYHTPAQVLAGVALGCVLGLAYFLFVSLIRDLGLVDLIVDLPILRTFYVKDTSGDSGSFVKDEFLRWRDKRMKARLIKVE
ncbi:Palmitoyl-protein thioesterase-dolichyl pyrophosphate phosphatase fusion 1 [Yarrowia sp. C11]|nr:Palmitoyl-protein thioesterase-dolichyl pyrophosphate phosphatase fusion 1 [Yarrowia sp. E02]KAG5367521.1 Palmitoyl-protein thioesterase-dolichyl pyrophosphate phosphatase fusion 1 [Yarrowia sp. C11]